MCKACSFWSSPLLAFVAQGYVRPANLILELRGQQKAIRAWVRLEDLSPTLLPDILKRSDLAANV